MIKRAKVIATYQINMYCDDCGTRMEKDEIVLMSYLLSSSTVVLIADILLHLISVIRCSRWNSMKAMLRRSMILL